MKTMRKICALMLAALLLFAGCAAEYADTEPPATTAAPTPVVTTLPETTACPSRFNEKGPFDDAHYEIGLKALQAVDGYLDGDLTLAGVNNVLSECYNDLCDLPELPKTDPLAAGNDFVRSYVFLAQTDFCYQLSGFETKKYQDRNYLAAAIGEPEKDFAPAFSTEDVDAFLDGVFASLQDTFPDSKFTYSWNDGNLFIDFNIMSFDYYYANKSSLSAEDRDTVREISHGYVSGDVAESIYNQVRAIGGDSFDVYITLSGSALFCASRNLQIYMDPLND